MRRVLHIAPMTSPPSHLPSAGPVSAAQPSAASVFDRQRVRRNRDKAARQFDHFAFLKDRALEDVLDRLSLVNRRFESVLDLGAHDGRFAARAPRDPRSADRVGHIISADLSPGMLGRFGGARVAVDEENLPFTEGSFDLVVSCLSLHWVNDLPGALIQIARVLRPDGLFIGSVFGGRSLWELRQCFNDAALERSGGVEPRVSPFADSFDMAGLLQRAGLALPVTDVDRLTLRYPSALRLVEDLRGMGETSALLGSKPLRRDVAGRALQLYGEHHTEADGKVRASVEIITATGWKPHASQQKPLRPGSAKMSLAQALGATEHSTGEAAPQTRLPKPEAN